MHPIRLNGVFTFNGFAVVEEAAGKGLLWTSEAWQYKHTLFVIEFVLIEGLYDYLAIWTHALYQHLPTSHMHELHWTSASNL
jgi:hypothetical protein